MTPARATGGPAIDWSISLNSSEANPPSRHSASLTARWVNQVREFWEALRNTPEAFRLVWSASRRAALVGDRPDADRRRPARGAGLGRQADHRRHREAPSRQGMEPVAGLRYVAALPGAGVRPRADRFGDEPGAQPFRPHPPVAADESRQQPDHPQGDQPGPAVLRRSRSSTIPCRTRGARRTSARSTSSTPRCRWCSRSSRWCPWSSCWCGSARGWRSSSSCPPSPPFSHNPSTPSAHFAPSAAARRKPAC